MAQIRLMLALLATFCYTKTTYASPLRLPHGLSLYSFDPLLASASDDVPVVQNNNYDMVMTNDQHTAGSMKFQNFDLFYDPQMADNGEYSMDETQFLPKKTPAREPQPLSAEERKIRQHVDEVDTILEKKRMLKLKKGKTVPRGPDANPWDQFDYDLYSVNPATLKKQY